MAVVSQDRLGQAAGTDVQETPKLKLIQSPLWLHLLSSAMFPLKCPPNCGHFRPDNPVLHIVEPLSSGCRASPMA